MLTGKSVVFVHRVCHDNTQLDQREIVKQARYESIHPLKKPNGLALSDRLSETQPTRASTLAQRYCVKAVFLSLRI